MNTIKRRKRRQLTVPEITLTPLIDTALTLLIIFMVTSPMIHNSLKFDLPKGVAQEGGHDQQELVVSVDQKGSIFFNEKPVSLDALGETLKNHLASLDGKQEKSVWVQIYALNTVDTFASVVECIKRVRGVKDVILAMQRPSATSA